MNLQAIEHINLASLADTAIINPALKYIHCAAYAAAGCWK